MHCLTSLLVAIALTQQIPAIQTQPPPKVDAPKADQASRYTLGPGDQLRITVIDEPDLTNVYRIESDGFITFPYLNRVAASGLTAIELQERIQTQLKAGYIKKPQVRVDIEQYKSQYIMVGGEVRTPGRVQLTGPMTLPEALAAAGSPTSTASNEIIVTHAKKPKPDGTMPDKEAESLHVSLKDLLVGRVGQDILLQDGDTVFVPKAQTFFITGEVRNGGTLIWEPGLTIQQAVAMAGGLTQRGSDRSYDVSRTVDGRLKDITLHKEDKVLPGDTITVKSRIF